MFTGLIEDIGTVRALTRTHRGARITIEAAFAKELRRGESVAVDGACLTAIDLHPTAFSAEISNESLSRTTLGELTPGSRVNLERALAVGARLGGHYVLGHVDGLGRIAGTSELGDALRIDITYPPELAPFIVGKGSIALDGISLTVNEFGAGTFWVAIISETQARTTLSTKAVGTRINLEGDILGKYVQRLLTLQLKQPGIDEAFLKKNGYL